MSESKHTPGPWRVIKSQLGDHTICAGSDDLAYLYTGDGMDGPAPYPVDANAHLIAAAPDLLAACRLALETKADDPAIAEQRRNIVRAAIAKAEGR